MLNRCRSYDVVRPTVHGISSGSTNRIDMKSKIEHIPMDDLKRTNNNWSGSVLSELIVRENNKTRGWLAKKDREPLSPPLSRHI